MKLKGIRLRGYRSFGPNTGIELDDLGAMSVIVGPNNVGKSNVFRFLKALRASLHGARAVFQNAGELQGLLALGCRASEPDSWLHLQQRIEAELFVEVPENLCTHWPSDVFVRGRTVRVTLTMSFRYESQVDLAVNVVRNDGKRMLEMKDGRVALWTHMNGLTPEPRADDPMTPVLTVLCRLLADNILDVQALRNFVGSKTEEDRFSSDGADVIHALEKLHEDTLQRNRWKGVRRDLVRWLRALLNEPAVDIVIKNKQLFVRLERAGTDIELALDELGTGAAQFVMVLAFLRLAEEPRVVLIEEPEAHLHPSAAAELLRVIRSDMPRHQLIVTTHSTSLLDGAGQDWRVFRASMTDDGTRMRPLTTTNEQLGLLADLGVRPSQLFLANTLVWVEGPSDVAYLRRLLRDASPSDGTTALEGRSHTFVPFGGSAIAHLGIEPDDDRLVQCLRISPRNVIVCDRDRGADQPLKPHVSRLVQEAERLGQSVHVLPVREIENLLEPQALSDAAAELVKGVRVGEKRKDVRFNASSLTGVTRFHEELALGATLADGSPLPSEVAASLAERVGRTKTGIAEHVCSQPTRVFTDAALEFGRSLLRALEEGERTPPQ